MTSTMSTIAKPFTPVTPPPENQTFSQKKPVPLQPPLNPPLPSSFHSMGWGMDLSLSTLASLGARDRMARQQQQLAQAQGQAQGQGERIEPLKRESSSMQPPPPPTLPLPTPTASQQPQAPGKTQPQPQPQSQPERQTPNSPPTHMDPKDFAMATRIAAFYQQRCHAIASHQQQRCQAWADTYRKKCQETMQAAMLVVAWYVRDRIRRRRRRQKDRFRRGLRERRARPVGVRKDEAVRRWMVQVPRDPLPPNSLVMDKAVDKEEEEFSMDVEAPPDKDAKLYEMAEGMIKSQYRKIEVPLMGVLSFDDSESESEEDNEGLCTRCMGRSSEVEVMGDPPEVGCEEGGEDDDYEDYEEDEELYEDEYMDAHDEELGSELVHGGGTGQHSQDTEAVLPL